MGRQITASDGDSALPGRADGLAGAIPQEGTRFVRPHAAFLLVALTFGPMLVFLTPPIQVPDEHVHFYRAYAVSEGHLRGRREQGASGVVGGDLPASLAEVVERVSGLSRGDVFQKDKRVDAAVIRETRKVPLEPQRRVFTNYSAVSWHSPLTYAFQAVGIVIGRWMGLGALGLLYAGRMTNLLGYACLVYAAIRIIPVCKWTMFLLAVMPMPLYLAASLSADTMTNGVSFLFISVMLRCAVDERPRIGAGRMLGLMILGAMMTLAKTAYAPLTLLFLMIPAAKFGGRRNYWLVFVLFLAVSGAAQLAWIANTYGAGSFSTEGINAREQAMQMLHHPLEAIRRDLSMLSMTLFSSMVGKFGWFNAPLNKGFVAIYLAVLAGVSLIGGRSDVSIGARQKWVMAAAILLCWFAVFTLVYLTFTKVGQGNITGLQGRYLVPLTPLVFLLLYNRRWLLPQRREAQLAVGLLLFAACSCIYMAIVILQRFYIA